MSNNNMLTLLATSHYIFGSYAKGSIQESIEKLNMKGFKCVKWDNAALDYLELDEYMVLTLDVSLPKSKRVLKFINLDHDIKMI